MTNIPPPLGGREGLPHTLTPAGFVAAKLHVSPTLQRPAAPCRGSPLEMSIKLGYARVVYMLHADPRMSLNTRSGEGAATPAQVGAEHRGSGDCCSSTQLSTHRWRKPVYTSVFGKTDRICPTSPISSWSLHLPSPFHPSTAFKVWYVGPSPANAKFNPSLAESLRI